MKSVDPMCFELEPQSETEPSVERVLAALRRSFNDDDATVLPRILDEFGHDCWPVSRVDARRGLHPTRPDVVVTARSVEDVVTVLRVAAQERTPVTARGLGSSVTGQPLPVHGGIVLRLDELAGPNKLDTVDLTVTVPAGRLGIDLEEWLNHRGLTLNHFPQSLDRSSVGGWLATRATGQTSSRYGGIEEHVVGYTVVLADGSVVEVGSRPRGAVGPDLRHVFLGSEGCFGVIVSVTLKVFHLAEFQVLEAFVLPDVTAGIDVMRTIAQRGIRPSLVRFYDESETRHATPDVDIAGCALFLAFEGVEAIAVAEHRAASDIAMEFGGVSLGAKPVELWMARRFDFSIVENLLSRTGGYAETIEVAHMWSGIEPMYEKLRAALTPLADEVLGHFSHVYAQGVSLYIILLGQANDDEQAARRLAEIWRTAMEVTVACGGELSHHHGAGLARQEYISRSLGTQHEVLRRLKKAMDPDGILNPGKLGL